jgi:heme exporter protein B
MWHSIKAVVQRDLKLVTRQGGDWLNPLSFFVMVITLFPLAISSTPAKLASMAGGVVWIAALLAVLLSMDTNGRVFNTIKSDCCTVVAFT